MTQTKTIMQLKGELRDAQKMIYKLWQKTYPGEPIDITYIWMDI